MSGEAVNTTVQDLLGALAGAPSLPGARCRGRPHLFDGPGPDEAAETVAARQSQALGLCRLCPSLDDCRLWLESLPAQARPPGTVAGCRVDDRGRITDTTETNLNR